MAIPSATRVCHFCGKLIRPSPRLFGSTSAPSSTRQSSFSSITNPRLRRPNISNSLRTATPTTPTVSSRDNILRGCLVGPSAQSSLSSHLSRAPVRTFISSAQHRQASVTQNPRKDEDGNDMLIDITPRAANRLNQIMTTDSNPNLALRVTVESGGCHGFQYLMSLTTKDKISEDEDTLFETADGARVVMDEPSLELLKGSKIDYTMELIGSQFKIVDNPAASSSCGCGTSFDIKA